MPKVTPFLWFNGQAEEAAHFYMSIFPEAKVVSEMRGNGAGPWEVGKIGVISIELCGQELIFMNGGPQYTLDEAFSIMVTCKDQAEIDYYWERLTEGGTPNVCGWLKDKFGVSWQVAPANFGALLKTPKQMQAMMGMTKFVIAELEAAGRE